MIATFTAALFTGCNDNNVSDKEITNKETTISKENEISSEMSTTEILTEHITEEITTELMYADWIDTLHKQLIELEFDAVINTITTPEFLVKCEKYVTCSISYVPNEEVYKLPISTGGVIGVVYNPGEDRDNPKTGNIYVFFCPDDTDAHKDHNHGFDLVGYGDIAVYFSPNGIVTLDGIHLKSTNPIQSSFDLNGEADFWMVWSV